MQETWVQYLGQEDPLEKGMITHCSILTLEIPWTEEPGRLQSMDNNKYTQYLEKYLHILRNISVHRTYSVKMGC